MFYKTYKAMFIVKAIALSVLVIAFVCYDAYYSCNTTEA